MWSEPPHRRHLDEVSSEIPLVMTSGDLQQAWLNTAGLLRYGFSADGDGADLVVTDVDLTGAAAGPGEAETLRSARVAGTLLAGAWTWRHDL